LTRPYLAQRLPQVMNLLSKAREVTVNPAMPTLRR